MTAATSPLVWSPWPAARIIAAPFARTAEFDLSPGEAKVLLDLQPDETVPMRALARRLRYDASNLTGIVDRLEERGAVERRTDPADRRVKAIAATRQGLHLRTGNLVFRGDREAGPELEHLLEIEAAKRLDLHTDFLVRTADGWAGVVEGNPFPDVAERDPSHLVVMFLKEAPDETAVEALRAAVTGPEAICAQGSHAYITYPNGIGRSRLTNTLIESKLGMRGTGRNWNTVLRLAALVRA